MNKRSSSSSSSQEIMEDSSPSVMQEISQVSPPAHPDEFRDPTLAHPESQIPPPAPPMPEVPAQVPEVRIDTDVRSQKIRKVSLELRLKSKLPTGSSLYDPVMVSLGPHHHGKSGLQQAEEFKRICLQQFLGDRLNKEVLRSSILEKIDKVRNSYAEVSPDDSTFGNDSYLAEMMLLDACFIIRYMEIRTIENRNDSEWKVWRYHLGEAGCQMFAARDIMVLENQIPFFVLKLVMSHKYSKRDWKNLVGKFLGWKLKLFIGDPLEIPRVDQHRPLHILAAFRRVLVESRLQVPNQRILDNSNFYTCGSVTDLKAKGIYFDKSSSHSFQDIKFQSRFFDGKLQLPVRYICDGTLVTFSNMIAYEICPRNNPTDLAVCSYIGLMKSLIQTPADVKELQEVGVFSLNRFANQEEVVEMFKRFDTLDLDNKEIYKDVMNAIGQHSRNKIKKWIAYDLIQTALRSPCTTIAWLSAISLFFLTCVSVYYAMHPVKKVIYIERNP